MSETETSGHYKHSYKSGPALNYSVHLYPKEIERGRDKRGKEGDKIQYDHQGRSRMKRR